MYAETVTTWLFRALAALIIAATAHQAGLI